MAKKKLAEQVAIAWIGLHLVTFASLLFAAWGLQGFSNSDLGTLFGIMAPMFTATTGMIIRYLIKNPHRIVNDPAAVDLALPLVVAVWAFGGGLFVMLNSTIFLYAYATGITSIDEAKIAVGITEAGLGVFATQLTAWLYEHQPAPSEMTPGTGPNPEPGPNPAPPPPGARLGA